MATYFVGQRVRVNCPPSEVHGEECHVTAIGVRGFDRGRWYVGVEVDIPCLGSVRDWCVFETHELIPILPDGHRACDDDFKRDLDRLLERQGIAA